MVRFNSLTSGELQFGLNSYNLHDPYGDNDADGLSNIFEYEHGLNLNGYDADTGGISVLDVSSGECATPDHYGETHYDIFSDFQASLWDRDTGSVLIRVYAEDYAMNHVQVEKLLKGALNELIDVLGQLLAPFLRVLGEAWREAQSAANFIA